jgi:hypothetical protein
MGPVALSGLDPHTVLFWSNHFPGLRVQQPDGSPIPLPWVMAELAERGVTVTVTDGQLRFRPAPPLVTRLTLPPWRDVLLHAWDAHRADRGLGLYACTECQAVTITKPTNRTKDRKKYRGGPDCRMTPGCPGRHDTPVCVPWADEKEQP